MGLVLAGAAMAALPARAQTEWRAEGVRLPVTACGEELGRVWLDPDVVEEIRHWSEQPVTTVSVRAQNEAHAGLGEADILDLDAQWVAERESDEQPLIAERLATPLSNYLIRMQAGSLGLYAEVFVTDDKGLNVGQSAVTSDFWQGDEAKWQQTYPNGAEAVFIDAAEFNEATATCRLQVSLSVADPRTGEAIGAITAEINLTEMERRSGRVLGSL